METKRVAVNSYKEFAKCTTDECPGYFTHTSHAFSDGARDHVRHVCKECRAQTWFALSYPRIVYQEDDHTHDGFYMQLAKLEYIIKKLVADTEIINQMYAAGNYKFTIDDIARYLGYEHTVHE